MADEPGPRYSAAFYDARREKDRVAARRVLACVLGLIGPVRSVVDVGCGRGTWLAVAGELGAEELLGLEGEWLDPAQADIPGTSLMRADLEQPLRLGRTFDLAVSLEVAEHLSPGRAATFVADLCASSELVLFSAAVPWQGGVHHVNERWQSYWAALFVGCGFAVCDRVRPLIWADDKIPYWYRQNMILYARLGSEPAGRLATHDGNRPLDALDLIHPVLYAGRTRLAMPGA